MRKLCFIISYNTSQCKPFRNSGEQALWERQRGPAPWEEAVAPGEALSSHFGLSWKMLPGEVARPRGAVAPQGQNRSCPSPPWVQRHPSQPFPPVVLLRYFKILPPFYRGEKY